MEQKVGICLQFSNPNQSGDPEPPPSPLSSFRLLSQHERFPPLFPPSHPRRGSTNYNLVYACHRHGHQHHDNTNANVNPRSNTEPPPPPSFASRYFIFPHFSLRRFVPSDEFAHPAPESNVCQTLKQIGRQLTNTSASVTSTT